MCESKLQIRGADYINAIKGKGGCVSELKIQMRGAKYSAYTKVKKLGVCVCVCVCFGGGR